MIRLTEWNDEADEERRRNKGAFMSFGTYLVFYYWSLQGNNLCENFAHVWKIQTTDD